MTHIEFFPYYNKLITFKLKGRKKLFYGMIIDFISPQRKLDTEYIFIEKTKLKEWRIAEGLQQKNKMKKIGVLINITNIISAQNEVDKAVQIAARSIIFDLKILDSLKA